MAERRRHHQRAAEGAGEEERVRESDQLVAPAGVRHVREHALRRVRRRGLERSGAHGEAAIFGLWWPLLLCRRLSLRPRLDPTSHYLASPTCSQRRAAGRCAGDGLVRGCGVRRRWRPVRNARGLRRAARGPQNAERRGEAASCYSRARLRGAETQRPRPPAGLGCGATGRAAPPGTAARAGAERPPPFSTASRAGEVDQGLDLSSRFSSWRASWRRPPRTSRAAARRRRRRRRWRWPSSRLPTPMTVLDIPGAWVPKKAMQKDLGHLASRSRRERGGRARRGAVARRRRAAHRVRRVAFERRRTWSRSASTRRRSRRSSRSPR